MTSERIERIINNQKYQQYLHRIANHEVEREYCGHDVQHFIDVARVAYILVLEEGLDIHMDVVYGAALLHDIGRWQQYEDAIPHPLASATLSEEILVDAGFSKDEIVSMLKAIMDHGNENRAHEKNLVGILYRADKLSRNCFNCSVIDKCKWDDEQKNHTLRY